MKSKNIKKIDLSTILDNYKVNEHLLIFLREIAYQTALANEKSDSWQKSWDEFYEPKTTEPPVVADHQWNQETLDNTSINTLKDLANAAITTIRNRTETFYLSALNCTFIGQWSDFSTENLNSVRQAVSKELESRDVAYLEFGKFETVTLESFHRGILAELIKRKEAAMQAKHATEVVAEDGADKASHIPTTIEEIREAPVPNESQPKNETPIEEVHEVPISIVEAIKNFESSKLVDDPASNPKQCTREAGHDGPCNGYPRYTQYGLRCWESVLSLEQPPNASELNVAALNIRLSQYYPGYGRLVWYDNPERLEVHLAKGFRPENRERIAMMIREHYPYGKLTLV